MNYLAQLDWLAVRSHYDKRVQVHHKLKRLYLAENYVGFTWCLLGIDDASANYSAHEHGLGPHIISNNWEPQRRIYELAGQLMKAKNGLEVPELIRHANLSYLKIAVGSEASMVLNPDRCWVTNIRSLWAERLIRYGDNLRDAAELLKLYRDGLRSEIDYGLWTGLHLGMDTALTRIATLADQAARQSGVEPGILKYMWADAVCNALYVELYSLYKGA